MNLKNIGNRTTEAIFEKYSADFNTILLSGLNIVKTEQSSYCQQYRIDKKGFDCAQPDGHSGRNRRAGLAFIRYKNTIALQHCTAPVGDCSSPGASEGIKPLSILEQQQQCQ